MPKRSKKSLQDAGVTCLRGEASFVDDHTVELDGEHIQADKFVIATGMKPLELDIPGEELMTSYEKFFELDKPPKEVVFAGGGYISLEFGNMLMRAGSKVTIIEREDHILSPFETRLADKLEEHLSKLGINFIKQAEVNKVEQNGDSYKVSYHKDDSDYTLGCNMIFNCAGRVPQIDKLGLDKIKLKTSDKGIEVDDRMESLSHSHIYACGDVSAKHLPLTPLSAREASVVKNNIIHKSGQTIDRSVIPSVVFTIPQFASVGMTVQEAQDSDKEIEVIEKDASEFYNVKRVNGELYSFVIILEKNNDNILGAHILGPEAAEQINLFAMAMTHGITMKEFQNNIFTYPSWCNDLLSVK